MRPFKWILIVLGALAVAGIAAGVLWWRRHGPELVEGAQREMADGRAYGRHGTAAQCVDSTLRRLDPARSGIATVVGLSLFAQACSEVASELPALCQQVSAGSLVGRMKRLVGFCTERGIRNPACAQVLQPVAELCKRRQPAASGG